VVLHPQELSTEGQKYKKNHSYKICTRVADTLNVINGVLYEMQKSPICTSTDRGNRSIDEEGLRVESNTADESMSLWRSQSGSVNTS